MRSSRFLSNSRGRSLIAGMAFVLLVAIAAGLEHERLSCADSGREAEMAWDWGPVYGCRLEVKPGQWTRVQRDLLP